MPRFIKKNDIIACFNLNKTRHFQIIILINAIISNYLIITTKNDIYMCLKKEYIYNRQKPLRKDDNDLWKNRADSPDFTVQALNMTTAVSARL